MMKHMYRLFRFSVVCAALLLACPSFAKDRRPRPPAVPGGAAVTVTKAKTTCFADTLSLTGVLLPRAEVLVRPDQEGMQITQVLADIGDTVKSGQTLVQLARPDGQGGVVGAPVAVQAPVAGSIIQRAATVGTMASARALPLFVIVAQGDLEVSAEVSAKDLARVAPGQPAKVKIIGVGELPGWVRFVSTAIDPSNQQGEVRVFVGANPALRVGTFARATLTLGQSCAIAIPLSAVLYGGSEGAVVQVVRDQRVETRTVKTGLVSEGNVQVGKGLAEGDLVVVRAGAFLRDGDPVRPVLPDEATASK
jgi:HlyD family secretion protein